MEQPREHGAGIRRRIGDEVSEPPAFVMADRRLERERLLLPHLLELLDLRHRRVERLRELFHGRRASELLEQALLLALVAREEQPDVHGDADGPGLIGQRADDRLPDPPRAVR